MTMMQDISQSGFRELKPEEVEAVSGGGEGDEGGDVIVVTARRPRPQPEPSLRSSGGGGGLPWGGFSNHAYTSRPVNPFSGLGAIADNYDPNGNDDENYDPDGDDDGDGIPNMDEEIVVTAPSELVEAVRGLPDGYIRGPGVGPDNFTYYAYPIGVNGYPDYTQPPILTPEGEARTCETYDQGQDALADTSAQLTAVTTIFGIPIPSNAFGPGAWFLGGVGNGTIAILSEVEPPSHCD